MVQAVILSMEKHGNDSVLNRGTLVCFKNYSRQSFITATDIGVLSEIRKNMIFAED
jgi:hypothetical protein